MITHFFFNQTRSHRHPVPRDKRPVGFFHWLLLLQKNDQQNIFFTWFIHQVNLHKWTQLLCILKPKYNCQKQKVKQTLIKLHGYHKAYLDSSSLHFPWTLESSLHYYKHTDAVWVVSKFVFLLRWLWIYRVDPSSIAGLWGPFLVPSPTLLSCLFLSTLCSLQE